MAFTVSSAHPPFGATSNLPTPPHPLLEFMVFSGNGMIQFEQSKILGLNGFLHVYLRQNVGSLQYKMLKTLI